MTLEGMVKNGVIVLQDGPTLAEGTRVQVVIEPVAEGSPKTAKELLTQFAGCMSGLPSDMARNHDHYVHGTPKR